MLQDSLWDHSSTHFALVQELHPWLTSSQFPKRALTGSVTFHSSRTMPLDREDSHADIGIRNVPYFLFCVMTMRSQWENAVEETERVRRELFPYFTVLHFSPADSTRC